MNLFFIIDEYSDIEPPAVVREMVDVMIDALNNPYKPRPEGENIFGQIMKELVKSFFQFSTYHGNPLDFGN